MILYMYTNVKIFYCTNKCISIFALQYVKNMHHFSFADNGLGIQKLQINTADPQLKNYHESGCVC